MINELKLMKEDKLIHKRVLLPIHWRLHLKHVAAIYLAFSRLLALASLNPRPLIGETIVVLTKMEQVAQNNRKVRLVYQKGVEQ